MNFGLQEEVCYVKNAVTPITENKFFQDVWENKFNLIKMREFKRYRWGAKKSKCNCNFYLILAIIFLAVGYFLGKVIAGM